MAVHRDGTLNAEDRPYKATLVMCPQPTQQCGFVIVDPRPEDYGQMLESARGEQLSWIMVSSGHDALQQVGQASDAVWFVNVHLDDMRGTEVLTLIRERRPSASVVLVSNRYCEADELAARAAGATAYLCKPAEATWLDRCRTRRAGSASRDGPMRAPN